MEKIQLLNGNGHRKSINSSLLYVAGLVNINDEVVKKLDSNDYKDYDLSIFITAKEEKLSPEHLTIRKMKTEKIEIMVKREFYIRDKNVREVLELQAMKPKMDFELIIKIF